MAFKAEAGQRRFSAKTANVYLPASFEAVKGQAEPSAVMQRRPHRKAGSRSPLRLLSIASLLALALLYLLVHCFYQVAPRLEQAHDVRRLASGGGPSQRFCSALGSQAAGGGGVSSQGQQLAANEAAAIGRQQSRVASYRRAVNKGWGLRVAPVHEKVNILGHFERMRFIADFCAARVARLPTVQALALVEEVAALAAIEAAEFSLAPLDLESHRADVIWICADLINATVRAHEQSDVSLERLQRLRQLLYVELNTRPTEDMDLVDYVSVLRSSHKICQVSGKHVMDALNRLFTQKKEESYVPSVSELNNEIRVLAAIRRYRTDRLLRIKAIRRWFIKCHNELRADLLFTREQYTRILSNPGLPNTTQQIAMLDEAVARARDSPPENQDNSQGTLSAADSRCCGEAYASWGEPGNEAAGQVDWRTATEQNLQRQRQAAAVTAHRLNLDLQASIASNFRRQQGLINTVHYLFLQNLPPEAAALILMLMTAEVGAFQVLPDPLETERQKVLELLIEMATCLVDSAGEAFLQEERPRPLSDILAILWHIKTHGKSGPQVEVRYYSALLTAHSYACEQSVDYALGLIKRISNLQRAASWLGSPTQQELQRCYNALAALVTERLSQLAENEFYRQSVVVAQTATNKDAIFAPQAVQFTPQGNSAPQLVTMLEGMKKAMESASSFTGDSGAHPEPGAGPAMQQLAAFSVSASLADFKGAMQFTGPTSQMNVLHSGPSAQHQQDAYEIQQIQGGGAWRPPPTGPLRQPMLGGPEQPLQAQLPGPPHRPPIGLAPPSESSRVLASLLSGAAFDHPDVVSAGATWTTSHPSSLSTGYSGGLQQSIWGALLPSQALTNAPGGLNVSWPGFPPAWTASWTSDDEALREQLRRLRVSGKQWGGDSSDDRDAS